MYMEPLRAPCMAKVAFGLRNLVGVVREGIVHAAAVQVEVFSVVLHGDTGALNVPSRITDAPILFLTARTDEASVLEGLGIGADDFLSKPFRVAELRARVAAHLRRQNRTPVHRLVRGGVSFDLSAREAAVGETPLPLTRSEYAICEYLALHAGQTFTKEQIYEVVFGIDGTADDTAVTQHIKNIRAKLRAAGVAEPEALLKTIWGVGYQWKNEG